MALEHITADLVKIDINGSIYEIPRDDVKAFITEKTSAKPTDESDTNDKSKKAKKAKKVEVQEAGDETEISVENVDSKDTEL